MLRQQNPFTTRFRPVNVASFQTAKMLSLNGLSLQKKQPAECLLFCGQIGETTFNRRDRFYAKRAAVTRTTY